ncbi:MAG: ATP synthase F1 subunit epsilon [Deltaproteobacteria bacterium]|nr:ATP synthase F1 subunit epsilon [Deltaproteobacteria bacterium]
MAETFLLEIATPSKLIFSDNVEMVTAPGSEGEFGVLRDHTEFLTTLKAGCLVYKKDGIDTPMAVSRGYGAVTPQKTTILVESAEYASDIDMESAEESLSEAEETLKGIKDDDPVRTEAFDKKELSAARIRVAMKKGEAK